MTTLHSNDGLCENLPASQALINVLLSGACSQIAILQQLARDSVTPYPEDGAKEVRETTGQHGHHRGTLLHLG